MERKWWREAVIYQIYPRSFSDSNGDGIGDLQGIISKLDYIKSIGIDAIWICPVYKSPNDDNGYDISDYQDVMEEFGKLSDLDQLISNAHKKGIKVIMDLVINHTSNEHPWFIESRSSKDNDKRDYYIWREGKNGREPNNWASFFSPSAWEYDEKTDEYYLHLFTKKMPDLNWRSPKVRDEIFGMIKWWLDRGVDGFRMDVINIISKAEGLPDAKTPPNKDGYALDMSLLANRPEVHDILKDLNQRVISKYDAMTVGETYLVTPAIALDYVGDDRHELNMIFHFELDFLDGGAMWLTKKPWKPIDFKNIIIKWQLALQGKGWNSLFLNNHDLPRMVSRYGNDSIYRVESAKMLATMLYTLQGTPFMYQGEEIGMTNVNFDSMEDYKDIMSFNLYHMGLNKYDHKKAMEIVHNKSRDNARTPMQWDDSINAGFTTGTPWIKVNPNYKEINVKSAEEDSESILNYYRKLIKLRKENLAMIYGEFAPILGNHESIFAYTRTLEEDVLLIIMNFCDKAVSFSVPEEIGIKKKELLISNYQINDDEDLGCLKFKPYESRIYRRN